MPLTITLLDKNILKTIILNFHFIELEILILIKYFYENSSFKAFIQLYIINKQIYFQNFQFENSKGCIKVVSLKLACMEID